MAKSSSDKAYDAGYKAGKEGGFMDDFVHGNKDIVPLPNGRHEGSYDGGYSDGVKDRYDSNNNHYQGGGGGGSTDSGCFITTATLISIGKLDDCEELNIFREYRDQWLAKSHDGKELIAEYYNIAPRIVTAINQQTNHEQIYKDLWKKDIEPCLKLIKAQDYEEAKSVYGRVVVTLREKYLSTSTL